MDAQRDISSDSGVTPTEEEFAEAWESLKERLSGAQQRLVELRDSTPVADENHQRLDAKQSGVFDALAIYLGLQARLDYDQEFTPGQAWRSFTLMVTSLYEPEFNQRELAGVRVDGYREGVDVALSYQRGYAPGIDTPVVIAPYLEG